MLSSKHNTPNPELSDFCDKFCLSNVIDKPTRVTDTTSSLINVILVSHVDRMSTSGNLHLGVSDHDLIYVIRKQRLPKPKAKTIEFRTTKNLDVNSFVKDLEEIPWDSAYAYDNIDDIWHHWATPFNQTLHKHVPLVQKKIANRQIRWITVQIRKEIRKRNQLYKKFRKNSTNMNWIKYKEQRNIVTSLKRNSIKNFCLKASLNKHKPGEFWKKLKPLLPSSNSSSDNSIHLKEGNKLITDPASVFNEYFCSPVIDQDALKLTEDFSSHSSVMEILNQGVNLNFSFAVINSEYLNDLLLTLDEKKSCGPDGISPKILKISTPAIAVPLTKLFNHCIDNSIWPAEWKHNNVIPAFKKDDPTSKTNYRPINLLSAIPKVFEKIICLTNCIQPFLLFFLRICQDSYEDTLAALLY